MQALIFEYSLFAAENRNQLRPRCSIAKTIATAAIIIEAVGFYPSSIRLYWVYSSSHYYCDCYFGCLCY